MKKWLKQNSWWLGAVIGVLGLLGAIFPKAFALVGTIEFWTQIGQAAIKYWLQLSIFTMITLLLSIFLLLVKKVNIPNFVGQLLYYMTYALRGITW